MTKAAVLPVPVRACPSTSTPASARGIKPACTGVGVRYSAFANASRMTGDRERLSKLTVDSSVCVANSATKYDVPDTVIFHNSIVASGFGQPGLGENDECFVAWASAHEQNPRLLITLHRDVG